MKEGGVIHYGHGSYIRLLREESGLTIRDCALKAGVSPSTLRRIEKGKSLGAVSSIDKIAKALGTTGGNIAGSARSRVDNLGMVRHP